MFTPHVAPLTHIPMEQQPSIDYDALVNDVSAQMATSRLSRRLSRGSSNYASTHGRHSARIEKPRSQQNSPCGLQRRKTTTGTKRYVGLEEHYNMMIGCSTPDGGLENVQDSRSARPLSWHPSSTQVTEWQAQGLNVPPVPSIPPLPALEYTNAWLDKTAVYDSADNDGSWPSTFAMNLVSSADHQHHMIGDCNSLSFEPSAMNELLMWPHPPSQQQTDSFPQPTFPSAYQGSSSQTHQSWPQLAHTRQASNRPLSVDFLPIQHPPAGEFDEPASRHLKNQPSNELVGMGLYDVPDRNQSQLTSGFSSSVGKGLKLEESWQPPEADEDDDEDEEEVDEPRSEDDSENEAPAVALSTDQQWQYRTSQADPANLSGQSFFFDEDETCMNEWWYQHLKQPASQGTAPLGYGWL